MNTITKILKISLLFLFSVLLKSSGCSKNNTRPCFNGGYSFKINSEWLPEKETYRIGDTIQLNSAFSKILTDQINPSIVVDYSNSVGIIGNLIILKIDTLSKSLVDAVTSFDYFTVLGQLYSSDTKPFRIKNAWFAELSDTYKLNIGLIPKEKGIFLIYVRDFGSRGLAGKNCTNAGFGMTVTNNDKHFSLYQYAMQQEPSENQKQNMYCFRVQ